MAPRSQAVRARFVDFELDFSSFELIRDGRRYRLQGQPFRVLSLLLDRAGDVVTREELQRQLWPDDTFVDFDQGLNKAIAKLREALDDSKASSKLIETIPRRGYRFTAQVDWVGSSINLPSSEDALQKIERRPLPARYWFASSLVLALLTATAFLFYHYTASRRIGAQPPIQSIAVLPLENLSNDPEQEYFAEGMTEQLITDLSYAKSLRVLSRSSTIGFKGSRLSVPKIAEQLHVDALIEGTVLRANGRIRVTIRLTAANPERQIWAASYERSVSDAITLQNQLAADAVKQIQAQLTPEQRTRLSLESQVNLQAYDEYLRARFLLNQETAQKDKAIPHLERAIQLDPEFAEAYAALGEAWGMEGVWGEDKDVREIYAKALQYSQKAVSLDPNSSQAYSSLGHSLLQNRKWNEAETALRRAIELDANNPYASEYLSLTLAQEGKVNESLRISRDLAAANPVAIDFRRIYAVLLLQARRYDEAIAECQGILELDPSHLPTFGTYGSALVEKGRFEEAEAAFKRGKELNPGVQAWLYARQGNLAEARRILKENTSSPINPRTAVAHYLLGEQELGLRELDDLANQKWSIKTYYLKTDPSFDPMRNDPRFIAILKKTGLLDN